MDVYRTEEEQVEALKKFFDENGKKILAIIILSVGSYIGFNAWQTNTENAIQEASTYFNTINISMVADGQMTAEKRAIFDQAFAELLSAYPDTIYASYASLQKARLEVDANELDKAAATLQWVVDKAFSDELVSLASLRLARVELARGNNEKALSLLSVDSGPFAGAFAELKGDVYLDQGKKSEALSAYKEAYALRNDLTGFPDKLLDIKIANLEESDKSRIFPVAGVSKASDVEKMTPTE